MVQRFSVCFLGVALLVACGGGAATDPPSPVNQDPAVNPNRPTIGWQDPKGNPQDPTTPSQRPTPPPQGVVVAVGPMDTSAGGSSNTGGSSNNTGGSGNHMGNGGSGNPPGGGKCTPDDLCAGCDTNNCLAYCNCLSAAVNGGLDCATQCP